MTPIKRNSSFSPALFSLIDDFLANDWSDYQRAFSGGSTLPAVNVKDQRDQWTLEVAAPGLSKEDFKLELNQRVLTISSAKEAQTESKEDASGYSRREFSYSAFSRSFTLPKAVNPEAISARYEQGVLFVHIPKPELATVQSVRTIEIA